MLNLELVFRAVVDRIRFLKQLGIYVTRSNWLVELTYTSKNVIFKKKSKLSSKTLHNASKYFYYF